MGAPARGRDAETVACRFLNRRGLRTVTRNFHCRGGELDLVMTDGDSLVFVEVRHRRRAHFGSGTESVDIRKQGRISTCARYYLQRHPDVADRPCRFDVVALHGDLADPRIEWITDAFPAH